MEKDKLLKDIGLDLDILQAHIKRLEKANTRMHQLDVDLLLDSTRKLYDRILKLKIEGSAHMKTIVLPETMPEAEIPEVSLSTERIGPKPLVVEMKVEEKAETEANEKATEGKQTKDSTEAEEKLQEVSEDEIKIEVETKDELKREVTSTPTGKRRTEDFGDPVGNILETEEPKITVKEEPSVALSDETTTTSKTTFDLFSAKAEETVADKLSNKDDSSVAAKMQHSKISDLKQAIGINEKFLFINELFNGDLGRYNKVIDEFNELKNQQGIDTYLFEMKIQNQWAEDSEAYLKLKELLDRKFG